MKIYFYKKCGVFEAYKKVSDFLYAEGLHGKHGAQMFSAFGYVYLADEKILARKFGFFKAAAAHAQALVNDGCAAAEAAGGLYLHLLLGEGTTQILEGLLCKLLCGKLLLKTHTHHDRAHIVVDDGLKNSILGILLGNTGIGHAFKADLRSQRKNIRSVRHCFSPYNFPPINIFCSLGLSIVYIMKLCTLSIIWRWY